MDEHAGWDKMRKSKEEMHFEEENRRAMARLTGKCKTSEAQPQSETQRQSSGERSAGLLGWLRSLFR